MDKNTIATGKEAAKAAGGIAWQSGSLMGINNPSNFGFRYSSVHKRYKYSSGDNNNEDGDNKDLPSSIVAQFRNRDGDDVGDQMDLPIHSDADQLSSLIHTLLHADDDDDDDDSNNKRIPYSFYAKVKRPNPKNPSQIIEDDIEVTGSLADLITEHQISTEDILSLTYHPLAVFKVRPVTRCTDTMPGHTEAILHVSYSPDGRHLASGGGDTTVRFWDTNTCLPRHTCYGHKNHVLCTAWSPDGKRFASADKNGMLITWDPQTGKPIATIKAHSKYISSMAWEPMHRIKVKRNASSTSTTTDGKEDSICERLVTASKDNLLKIWNVRTRQCEVTMSGHMDSVESVKWGGEGLIYSCSRDRTIKVWCAEPTSSSRDVGKLVRTLKGHAHRINSLALSCDYVCRTGPFDHKCKKFPTNQEAIEAAIEKYKNFKGSDEPERLVSGSDDFTLFLWHPTEGKQPIKRLTGHQQLVNHIAFSPDGRYFASASFDKKVKIWNGKSGDFLSTLTGHVGAVYQVAWSADSRFLVSASKDSTAKLWEMPNAKKARETLPGHADEVYALDWSPNGNSVATGSKDRTIKVWKH